jgi:hypothetical protein
MVSQPLLKFLVAYYTQGCKKLFRKFYWRVVDNAVGDGKGSDYKLAIAWYWAADARSSNKRGVRLIVTKNGARFKKLGIIPGVTSNTLNVNSR